MNLASKKFKSVVLAVFVVGSLAVLAGAVLRTPKPPPPLARLVNVQEVRDGARAKTTDGQTIVYAAIRAPYRGEPLFEQSRDRNAELVANHRVRLRFDKVKRDHKQRLVAYVYYGKTFVNETLVGEGLAYARIQSDHTSHADQLLAAQRTARREQRGIWSQPPPPPSPTYLGDPKYGNFHRPQCDKLSGIDADRLIEYARRDAALDAGLAPCAKCRP